MNGPTEEVELHDLAAAYALDALDALERRRFEAHYPDCEACAEELPGFRATAARLAESTATAPPAELKARVMQEAARTRQLPPRPAPPSDSGSGTVRWARVGAVAAIVVVLAVGAGFAIGRSVGGPGITDTDDSMAEVLAAPDATTVELAAHGPASGTLRVVWSPEMGRAVMVGSGLDVPAEGHDFQLWTVHDGARASAGVFTPHDGDVEVAMEAPTEPVDTWAVTVEPAGGSRAPTGEVLYLSA